jgi:hypothetical protein
MFLFSQTNKSYLSSPRTCSLIQLFEITSTEEYFQSIPQPILTLLIKNNNNQELCNLLSTIELNI